MKEEISDDCNGTIEQDTPNQHAVCSVCRTEFPVENMHVIDDGHACFSKQHGNIDPSEGKEDVLPIEDAVTSLRKQIIADITKEPVLKYQLTSLFWSDAAKCFPGPGFNWDGAWFKLDLQTGKLLVELGTYPNAFGASRSDCINLSAAEFNEIAKQFHMRKELQAFESDDDWAKLFDESLKTAVSSACAILQKRDEERRNEEIKQYSVKIPEQYAKQTPDMCLSKFTIEIWQRYASRSIEVSNDNGNYKIVYILRSHTSPQLDIYPRVLSTAESVWLEKQVEITINNPDESTWTSLPGGDMMNLLIKRDMGPNIEIKCVKPIRKYSDLQHEFEHLAQYGSTLCQQPDPAAVNENNRTAAEESRRREEENRRRATEEKKRSRIIETLTCAAIVLLCVVKLALFPNIWHREAVASIDEGGYDETIAISSEPETDEDSANQILETEHISDASSSNTYLLGDTGMSIDFPSGSFVLTREDFTEETSDNPLLPYLSESNINNLLEAWKASDLYLFAEVGVGDSFCSIKVEIEDAKGDFKGISDGFLKDCADSCVSNYEEQGITVEKYEICHLDQSKFIKYYLKKTFDTKTNYVLNYISLVNDMYISVWMESSAEKIDAEKEVFLHSIMETVRFSNRGIWR